MPSLVMRAPAGSLIEQTSRLVVRRQVNYGATLDVPWGISESAYNVRDLEHTYQYSNFGVPGLGLKRGLGENAVVAPYATALAAMVDPGAAARNFARLAAVGARGRYGFYEALDYTPTRLPEGQDVAIVRAFMAHHQGMTVVAIANALLDGAMRERFHAEPIVQATELLLQERTPRDVAVAHPRAEEVATAATVRDLELPAVRRLRSPHTATPQVHLLSNGRYAVMLTGAGSGYSRWGDLGITRWREDVTRDDWGAYVFLRDVQSGDVWSAGYQPSGVEPDGYEVTFTEDRAEFVRHDGPITTTLEVVVSPEDNAEVRRISVANAGDRARDIEVTSYAELVLAPPAADTAHPAFSKLFVQTEYLAQERRHPGDAAPSLARRARDLGGAPRRRRRRGGGRAGARDRPRPLPRPRRRGPGADRGDGRPAALQHRRHRARSRLRAAPARAGAAGQDGAHRVLDGRRVVPRRGAGPDRQASGRDRLRPRGHAGVDPGAGAVELSRHRRGGGRPLPASRRPRALRRSVVASVLRRDSPRRRRAGGALGAGHLGRPADRPRADRRHRGRRDRAPVAARPRVLADEAARRRSRDPERAGVVLHPGSSGRAGDAGPDEPVPAAERRGPRARRGVRPARGPHSGGDARPASRHGARGPGRTPRNAVRTAEPPPGSGRRIGGNKRAAAAPAVRRRHRRPSFRRRRTSSSSTASADSPRTAAST